MKNKKVLIVDDNALNRKVFENIIGHSFQHDIARDGLEAIDKIKQGGIDIVLMDIQMPKLDGISALKIIKEDNLTDIPIIAISAYSNQTDREYFLSTGFDDFIAKPVKPKDLLETLQHHLDHKVETTDISEPLAGQDDFIDHLVISQLLKYHSLENIKEVYNDFLEETENLVNEIKNLVILKKYSEIGEKLHIIKGNSGTLGIKMLFNVSSKYESDVKNSNFELMDENYTKLENSLSEFKERVSNKNLFKRYE
ncbi:Hpt domain-containing response regulator [Pleomorphovibrio marinus]|uniref:Hpt domain-containing response regulator n=1 Tax=Pleomorphovibrio marinus TaxID=2164132 RepID=UPI000E0B5687|nr:response regulator [Pleomorphovibrio marinus]